MSWELVHTSVPKGLTSGTSGFCTVARSRDLSPALVRTLESLSGYRRLSLDSNAASTVNPIAFSYLCVESGGKLQRVVSRVADAGLDHTGRANKIAHHIVLSPNDLNETSPASLFTARRLFYERWEGEARFFDESRNLPSIAPNFCRCETWRLLLGDPGWGGYVASTVFTRRNVVLIIKPDVDALRLFLEAIATLPSANRWDATFSTYFIQALPGVRCQWKAVYAGTPEEKSCRAQPNSLIVDLTGDAPKIAPGPEKLNALAQTVEEQEFIDRARKASETGRIPPSSLASPATLPSTSADARLCAPDVPLGNAQETDVYQTNVEENGVYQLNAQDAGVTPVSAQETDVYAIKAQDADVYPVSAQETDVYELKAQEGVPVPGGDVVNVPKTSAKRDAHGRNAKYDYGTEKPRSGLAIPPQSKSDSNKALKIALIVVSAIAALAIVVAVGLFVAQRGSKKPEQANGQSNGVPSQKDPKNANDAKSQETQNKPNDAKSQETQNKPNDAKSQKAQNKQNDAKSQKAQNNANGDVVPPQSEENAPTQTPQGETNAEPAPTQTPQSETNAEPASSNAENDDNDAKSQEASGAANDVASPTEGNSADDAASQPTEPTDATQAQPEAEEKNSEPTQEEKDEKIEALKAAFKEFQTACNANKIGDVVAYAATIDGTTQTPDAFATPELAELFVKTFKAWEESGRDLEFGVEIELLVDRGGLIDVNDEEAVFDPQAPVKKCRLLFSQQGQELAVCEVNIPAPPRKRQGLTQSDDFSYNLKLVIDNNKPIFKFEPNENTPSEFNIAHISSLGLRVAFYYDQNSTEPSTLYKSGENCVERWQDVSQALSRLYGNFPLSLVGLEKKSANIDAVVLELNASTNFDAYTPSAFCAWRSVAIPENVKSNNSCFFERAQLCNSVTEYYKRIKKREFPEINGQYYFPYFIISDQNNKIVVKRPEGDWSRDACVNTLRQYYKLPTPQNGEPDTFAEFQLPERPPFDWTLYFAIPQNGDDGKPVQPVRLPLATGKLE